MVKIILCKVYQMSVNYYGNRHIKYCTQLPIETTMVLKLQIPLLNFVFKKLHSFWMYRNILIFNDHVYKKFLKVKYFTSQWNELCIFYLYTLVHIITFLLLLVWWHDVPGTRLQYLQVTKWLHWLPLMTIRGCKELCFSRECQQWWGLNISDFKG